MAKTGLKGSSVAVAPEEVLLQLKDVHAYLGSSHILQGVNFDVVRGQTTVLLGRNGAGKTTTFRTIMGMVRAQRGSIALDGDELVGRPTYTIARQGIGLVPEDREVFVTLTIEENLRLAVRSEARQESSQRIERAYSLFPDLRAARHRSASALSGGQQQMLAIARVLMNPNRVILIDEPTKGLAPIIVRHLQSILAALRDEGETILLVEQNLDFARALGDHFFILDEGRIVDSGSMSELAERADTLQRYIGV